MKSVVILGFLVASSLALTVTQLNNGVAQLGSLLPTTTGNNYVTDLYSFFVPAGASSVGYSFSNTNTACTYLHIFLRTSSYPCNDNAFNSSYQCGNAADPGNGISGTVTDVYYPGESNNLLDFVDNGNWYIGISRYGSYNTQACTYSLTMNYTTCPAGQTGSSLGLGASSSSPVCLGVNNITLPYMANISANASAPFAALYKFNVPFSTGHIYIQFTTTSTGTYLYGNSYSPAASSYYNCYTGSYNSDGNGNYTYSLFCYTPRSGDFYLTIYDNSGFGAASLMVNALVCGAGMGGYNCTYPSTFLDFSMNSTFSFTNTINPAGSVLTYPFVYYFFDVPMGYNGSDVSINLATTTGSTYLYYRLNGYNEDSSTYGYEDSSEYDSSPAQFIVNGYEFGRVVIGVECYSTSTPCTYNLAVGMAASVTSTTGMMMSSTTAASGTVVSTTGSTSSSTGAAMSTTGSTGMRMTTGRTVTGVATGNQTTAAAGTSTSSAFAIVPSVIALVAMMF